MHYIIWGTLLTTENRAPFLVPSLITSLSSLLLTLGLIHFVGLGGGALVIGPLVAAMFIATWTIFGQARTLAMALPEPSAASDVSAAVICAPAASSTENT